MSGGSDDPPLSTFGMEDTQASAAMDARAKFGLAIAVLDGEEGAADIREHVAEARGAEILQHGADGEHQEDEPGGRAGNAVAQYGDFITAVSGEQAGDTRSMQEREIAGIEDGRNGIGGKQGRRFLRKVPEKGGVFVETDAM